MSKSLVQNLRTLMRDQGVKQVELARRSGVGKSTVSRILRGEVAPTTQTLEPLATALGVTSAFLLAGKREDVESRASNSESPAVANVSRLVNCYAACDAVGRKLLLEMAEKLANISKTTNHD